MVHGLAGDHPGGAAMQRVRLIDFDTLTTAPEERWDAEKGTRGYDAPELLATRRYASLLLALHALSVGREPVGCPAWLPSDARLSYLPLAAIATCRAAKLYNQALARQQQQAANAAAGQLQAAAPSREACHAEAYRQVIPNAVARDIASVGCYDGAADRWALILTVAELILLPKEGTPLFHDCTEPVFNSAGELERCETSYGLKLRPDFRTTCPGLAASTPEEAEAADRVASALEVRLT